MTHLLQGKGGSPHLQLAPMEGVGDATFRKALASIGGFDEAVRDFLRVPSNAHVQSLAKVYDSQELAPIPVAAQIMGSDPQLMAEMALELIDREALRIDVNCGCPSNTVTGRGAGSSLLKDPDFLYKVVRAVVHISSVPVTVKMRSGYEDTSLFQDNLLAVEESGAAYVTLHPRTKADGYGPPANWDLIAEAKSLLSIPVVGNGDILTLQDALTMLSQTRCDGLMIGRGAVINPFLFQEIRAHFEGETYPKENKSLLHFLHTYHNNISQEASVRLRMNKLKQLLGFLFKRTPALLEKRQEILSSQHTTSQALLEHASSYLMTNPIVV